MQGPALYWTQVAAIGQVAGAIATAAAVILSLWIVLSERKLQASGRCGIKAFFAGDGSAPTYMIGLDITNTGLRPLTVAAVGWRTGWFRRGPSWLGQQFAVQAASHLPYGASPPFELAAGTSKSVFTLLTDFAAANNSKREEFFWRPRPWGKGFMKTPIHAIVSISGRRDLYVKVEPSLAEFLRTGQHELLAD